MPTEVEIIGRREMPGLDATNPRALHVVIFYRAVADPSYADFVALPTAKANDAAINEAIATKERGKSASPARRVTIG